MTEAEPFDPLLDRVLLVDHLPSDSWTEGVAVRPDGNVLTSRLDSPELYAINMRGDSWTTKPKLVYRFPNATGAFNVCRLRGTGEREEYAVISGFADLDNAQFHSWAIWRVCPPPDGSTDSPKITKIADLHEAVFCMGMITVGERTLLICDAAKCCIWKLDIPTGHVSVFLSDAVSMAPSSKEDLFGVNRCRIYQNHLYFTNHSAGTFCRVPIEHSNGEDIRASGPVQKCAEGLTHAEGLVMSDDAKHAWIVDYVIGKMWRVDLDPVSGESKVNLLREDLLTPTTMELITDAQGKRTLYIVCCGAMDPDWCETEKGQWARLASVDPSAMKIHVTITTEITYTYEDA